MLFPAEYRSLASGSMNFISRGFTAVSVVLVEYTNNPIMFVLLMSGGLIFALAGLITEPTTKDPKDQEEDYISERSHSKTYE